MGFTGIFQAFSNKIAVNRERTPPCHRLPELPDNSSTPVKQARAGTRAHENLASWMAMKQLGWV